MKKRVAVLGATGSIGKSTLDVLREESGRFEPVLFAAGRNGAGLLNLKKEFPGALTALVSANGGEAPSPAGIDFTGKDGLLEAVAAAGADITVNGISGAAGLEPSAAALRSGSDLALANKESVVMAGHIIFNLARENNARIIPVDSEHTGVLKLIEAHGRDAIDSIIITASGGPFLRYSKEKLKAVTPREALAHPTWSMGPKITVDSASLANKGLEVIEAAGYFGFPPEKTGVVVHPQSVVHAMVRLKNGAVYAQMSKPDMRLTIHDALLWPGTGYSPFGALDFESLSLTFEKPDFERFPMLALAYKALEDPVLSIAYNAADEVAVEAFFQGKAGFLEIPRIAGYVLDRCKAGGSGTGPGGRDCGTIAAVLEWDRKAREIAWEIINSGTLDGGTGSTSL